MSCARRLRTLVLVVIVGAGSATCSEAEPEPRMPTSPSTSSSSSSAPATEPTAEPTEPWQEKSYAGAEAFATHWFDVFSEAMPTGDTTEMRAISDPECANCNATFETLEGFYEDGGYFKSRGWVVKKATSAKSSPLSTPTVGLRIVQHAARFKHSSSEPEERGTRTEGAYAADLRWAGDGWLMVRFEPVG